MCCVSVDWLNPVTRCELCVLIVIFPQMKVKLFHYQCWLTDRLIDWLVDWFLSESSLQSASLTLRRLDDWMTRWVRFDSELVKQLHVKQFWLKTECRECSERVELVISIAEREIFSDDDDVVLLRGVEWMENSEGRQLTARSAFSSDWLVAARLTPSPLLCAPRLPAWAGLLLAWQAHD